MRLADEGVPLRAIARATNTPSDILRDKLHKAQDEGKLLGLPREDWPPGFPRDQRALRLSRMVTQDPETASLAMQQVFRLTPTEASLLMILIQSPNVPRERLGMTYRTVDVHICRIRRRLAPYQISIAEDLALDVLRHHHHRDAGDLGPDPFARQPVEKPFALEFHGQQVLDEIEDRLDIAGAFVRRL